MPELVVTLKGRELQRVAIATTDTAIGRDPGSEVCIDNVGVSRTHAVVRCRQGIFRVHDHGSANGLFVNGAPVGQAGIHALQDGDEIQVGKFVVVFSTRAANRASELSPGSLVDNSQRTDLDDNRRKSLADATTHLSASDIAKLSLTPLAPDVGERPIERLRAESERPEGRGAVVLLSVFLGLALLTIAILVIVLVQRV